VGFDNCGGVFVTYVHVFIVFCIVCTVFCIVCTVFCIVCTVFLYCFVYVYLFLFFVRTSVRRGTAVAQWLKCCATNRKIAGSIPADVIGIFY
jgi:hypothetical protein